MINSFGHRVHDHNPSNSCPVGVVTSSRNRRGGEKAGGPPSGSWRLQKAVSALPGSLQRHIASSLQQYGITWYHFGQEHKDRFMLLPERTH